MRAKNHLCVLLFGALLLAGCQAPSTNPADKFTSAFKQAHENKDIDGMLQLVHLDGVEDDIRQNLIASFKDTLALKILRIELIAPTGKELTKYTQYDRTFVTNLDVKKVLVIYSEPQSGQSNENSTKYLVGEVAGEFRITTAVPVK